MKKILNVKLIAAICIFLVAGLQVSCSAGLFKSSDNEDFFINENIPNHISPRLEGKPEDTDDTVPFGILILYTDQKTKEIAVSLYYKIGGDIIEYGKKINDSSGYVYIFIGTGEEIDVENIIESEYVTQFDKAQTNIIPFWIGENRKNDELYDARINHAVLIPGLEINPEYDRIMIDGLMNSWIDSVFSWDWANNGEK